MWVLVRRSCNRWESQNGSESISQGISSSSCSFNVIRMVVDWFTKCALFLLSRESSNLVVLVRAYVKEVIAKFGVLISFVFISLVPSNFREIWKCGYRLEFPDEFSGIHPFFRVTHLRKGLVVGVSYVPLEEIMISNKFNYLRELIAIMEEQLKRVKIERFDFLLRLSKSMEV